MNADITEGIKLILILAPMAMAAWVAQLYVLFYMFGVNARTALDEITLPESLFFGAWGIASAHLIGLQFSRFI